MTYPGYPDDDDERVAGKALTPADKKATARLKWYWSHGAGAAKIGWGTPGDFNRCRLQLGKYVPQSQLDGLCANLHKMATGAAPGKGH